MLLDQWVADPCTVGVLERMPSGCQLGDRHAKRPPIAAGTQRRASLGGEVGQRPLPGVGHPATLPEVGGQTEVGEHQVERLHGADQDVGRLDVAVHGGVHGRDRLGHLGDDLLQGRGVQRAVLHQPLKGSKPAVLLDLEVDAGFFDPLDDVDGVVMLERALVLGATERVGVPGLPIEDLDGHLVAGVPLDGPVDVCLPASAKMVHQPIPGRQPGRQIVSPVRLRFDLGGVERRLDWT